MTTATLGACVGHAYIAGHGDCLVFDAPEPGWFLLQDSKGARYRRRRDQIEWRTA